MKAGVWNEGMLEAVTVGGGGSRIRGQDSQCKSIWE